MTLNLHGVEVFGVDVDNETRCAHWHSALDIIAIKFKCCGLWYPCFDCHREIADHQPDVWQSSEFDEEAVLCGSCGHQLTITEYLASNSKCTECHAEFNPGCAKHYHLYFQQ